MRPTARTLLRPAALGTVLAAVGVAVVHLLATALGDPLVVDPGGAPQAVPLGAAVLFTAFGGAVGYGLALLARRAGRPRAVFLAVTLVALALFAVSPSVPRRRHRAVARRGAPRRGGGDPAGARPRPARRARA